MKKNKKHEVMMMANEIRKATGKSRSVCLVKAWQLSRLDVLMHEGNVRFAYERADGSLRKATGTLRGLERFLKRPAHLQKDASGKRYRTFCYFDTKASAFRSFRVENLITIYG